MKKTQVKYERLYESEIMKNNTKVNYKKLR